MSTGEAGGERLAVAELTVEAGTEGPQLQLQPQAVETQRGRRVATVFRPDLGEAAAAADDWAFDCDLVVSWHSGMVQLRCGLCGGDGGDGVDTGDEQRSVDGLASSWRCSGGGFNASHAGRRVVARHGGSILIEQVGTDGTAHGPCSSNFFLWKHLKGS